MPFNILMDNGLDLANEVMFALLSPFYYPLDPSRRIFLGFILVALLMAYVIYQPETKQKKFSDFLKYFFQRRIWLHRSSILDIKLMFANSLIKVLFIAPAMLGKLVIIVAVSSFLRDLFGPMETVWLPYVIIMLCFTAVVFIAEDLTRYMLHYAYHRIPCLWEFHKVHHSAEVLTPLTLYRIHPLESFLSQWASILVIGSLTGVFVFLFPGQVSAVEILGVDALGFIFNALGANLRHSHIAFSFGSWDRWFISPQMHQIHHSRHRQHHDKNFGSCFAIWDKLAGTLYLPQKNQTLSFGCTQAGKHTVLSQWFSPVVRVCQKKP